MNSISHFKMKLISKKIEGLSRWLLRDLRSPVFANLLSVTVYAGKIVTQDFFDVH